jgi:hypothetical protein
MVLLDINALFPFSYSTLKPSIGEPTVWRPGADLSNLNQYIVCINITKINNPRKFYEDIELGNRVVCDIELNDLIKYCQIEYEIICGLIWKDGSDNTAREWVNDLYTKRKTDPAHNQIFIN